MAAFVPGKGRIICDRGTAGRPAKLLLNVPVTPTEAAQHVVKVTEAARARFTAYVRNDSDEYRHCNGVLDHGERSDSGRCTGLRRGLSSAEQRALIDEDSRVILRIEGRGPDGLSFAAVEVVLSGASTRPLGNAYTQADGDALNSNATAGGAL